MSFMPPQREFRPPSDPALIILQVAGEELSRRSWMAWIVHYRLCGEPDVRLHVSRHGGAVVVEVLGPFAMARVGKFWSAVRIESDRRIVWSGPASSCTPSELVGFVEDLLSGDAQELDTRYCHLG